MNVQNAPTENLNMKSFLLTGLMFLTGIAFGQTKVDQRTRATQIADLLSSFPAQNQAHFNKNMQAISALGENGFAEMVKMLGTGATDTAALEYALAGYSQFVTQPGKESLRAVAVKAYCNALSLPKQSSEKEFIISQLQLIGKEDAVACLTKALQQKDLAAAAARSLAQVNTPASKQALLLSLNKLSGENRLAVIEALGFAKYKPATPSLLKLAAKATSPEKKLIYYALSQGADPAAAALLQKAAKDAGYTYDVSDAVTAYLIYIRQLNATGNAPLAGRLTAKLLQDAKGAGQLHTRIAALELLTRINGSKSLPLLQAAMQDTEPEYRAAALQFASRYVSPATQAQWVNKLLTASPEAQVQLLHYLTFYPAGPSEIIASLAGSENEAVRMAALKALSKNDPQQSVPLLIKEIQKGNATTTEQAKNILLTVPGDQVPLFAAEAMNNVSAQGKIALLEILQARAAHHLSAAVFTQLRSNDTSIQKAALRALPAVVTEKDLATLYPMMAAAGKNEIGYYQQAMIEATSAIADTAARSSAILQQMRQLNSDQQARYLPVLAAIGNREALHQIQTAYNNGNDQTKTAAIQALALSNGMHTARLLRQIANSTTNASHKESAVNALLDVIRRLQATPEQKLLLLQDAMEFAQSGRQKQIIIRESGNTRTFPALVFVGRYLDSTGLQQPAAQAVVNIVTSVNDLTGETVRTIINKTITSLRGGDAGYQREALQKYLRDMQPGEGFISLFNGKDLTGWKGLVENPVARAKMSADTLNRRQAIADRNMREGWIVRDGLLVFTGKGDNLATERQFGDFEMYVDWKITKDGDAGIYLRGTPQVQIWDTARISAGAQVGSGGLYNNQKNVSKPLQVADNPPGEWNQFHIIMKGDQVTVYLNGVLVTDKVTMENYWDRNQPIFPREQIELQAHGTYVAYRNLYIRDLSSTTSNLEQEKQAGFEILFDGTNLDQWTGNKTDYKIDNGTLLVEPKEGNHGNLYTKEQYSDFIFRFEFQLTPGANNGLGIRTPMEGDAAYEGMELQILDNEAPVWRNLQPWQYHGSVYGVIPAKRGFLKPAGEWNTQEVIAKGSKIKVILNGEVILDGDIAEASKNGTVDKREHPGLHNKTGHIGFLGHGSVLRFRNIRVKRM